MKHNQKGTIATYAMFVLLVVFVCAVGTYVFKQSPKTNQAQKGASDALSNEAVTPKPFSRKVANVPIDNFYACYERESEITGKPSVPCTYEGKTYIKPTSFTTDMIENLSLVPRDAIQSVTKIAQKNFECDNVSIMKIYGSNDSFVYYSVGCDGGYRGVIAKSKNWDEIVASQSGVSCEIIKQYKIPKTIFALGNPAQTDCYDVGGNKQPYPTI
jgi:hypothetical protein